MRTTLPSSRTTRAGREQSRLTPFYGSVNSVALLCSHDTDWRKSYWTINRSPEAAGAAQKVAAPVTCEPIRSGLQDLKNELKKVSPLQSLSAHRIPNKNRRPPIV